MAGTSVTLPPAFFTQAAIFRSRIGTALAAGTLLRFA
jgi:hypothetical protein